MNYSEEDSVGGYAAGGGDAAGIGDGAGGGNAAGAGFCSFALHLAPLVFCQL